MAYEPIPVSGEQQYFDPDDEDMYLRRAQAVYYVVSISKGLVQRRFTLESS